MRSLNGYQVYLSTCSISDEERKILNGFIDQRNAIRPTGIRTKGKQAYEGYWIASVMRPSSLDICNVHDLLRVASDASSGKFTKNSRQTKIVTLKALANYIHRFHHEIPNLDLLTHDVKAGSAQRNRKDHLILEEWETVLNTTMPARDRALIALMYDGYLRPMEPLLLKWSDMRENEGGYIEYEITFKTEKPRVIVQKPGTTAILEAWRRECGGAGDTPIFPGIGGKHYATINVLKDLFARLKKQTGITKLKPSILRTSGITHDVEAGLPVSYICLRAWGEPYNELINLYARPDSAKIQADQHIKNDLKIGKLLGSSGKYSVFDPYEIRIRSLRDSEEYKELLQRLENLEKGVS